MKNTIIAFLLIIVLASCKNDATTIVPNFLPTQLVLISMEGNMPNSLSLTTGSAMSWQETYLLRIDSSFLKTRVYHDSTVTASGTFSAKTISSNKVLVFTYSDTKGILASCYSNTKEEKLWVKPENRFRGDWGDCDGPILIYEVTPVLLTD